MRRVLVVVFLLTVLFSCQLNEPELYKDKSSIKVDSLNIEQIKIPTH